MNASTLAVLIALALFGAAKAATWWRAAGWTASRRRSLAYALLWSGMDAPTFLHGPRTPRHVERRGAVMAVAAILGGIATLTIATASRHLAPLVVAGTAALAGFALVLHFGALRLSDVAWRAAGVDCRPLMCAPLGATSLADFWARRWNTSFATLSAELAYRPLRSRFGSDPARMITFFVSGIVHELAITVPARGGHGGPAAFFLLQGLGVSLERSARGRAWGLGHGLRGRVFALATLILPVPLLFPAAFLERVVLPLASTLTSPFIPPEHVMTSLLDLALWLAGIAHFCVLAAGVQVPHRLAWRTELARLSRFNQRIVWAYHAFIGLTILGFGTLTLVLHDDIMRGDRAALGLVALMAGWWLLRLAIDAFWYSHEDWPRGRVFAIGHALLIVAFVGMAGTYVAVLVAHGVAG